jgi:hypothetical protein
LGRLYVTISFYAHKRRKKLSPFILYTLLLTYFHYMLSSQIGVGIGASTMAGSTMYVGWFDASGNPVLTERQGGRGRPSVSGTNFALVSSSNTGGQQSFTFRRPLNAGLAAVSLNGATNYIWAVGPGSSESFTRHTSRDSFSMVLTDDSAQAGTPSASSTSTNSTTNTTNTTTTSTAAASSNSTTLPSNIANDSYCNTEGTFCVSAIANSTANLVYFTVISSVSGWAGLGIGSTQMTGSTMYIGWRNSSGNGITFSQRSDNGRSLPTYNSNGLATLVSALPTSLNTIITTSTTSTTTSSISNPVIVYTFSRPLNGTQVSTSSSNGGATISTTGRTNFIWGVGSTSPSGSETNNPAASFSRHNDYGSFSMDLSKFGATQSTTTTTTTTTAKVSTDSGYDYNTLITLHAVLLFVGWGVLPYIAIFIARYLKDRLGHLWYQLHTGIMIFGVGLFSIGGLVCVQLLVGGQDEPRFFTSLHGTLGTVLVLMLYPVQVGLGFVSNRLWSPERVSVPWWDKVHWWLGRLSVVLSLVVFGLGLRLGGYGVGWYALVYVIVALGVSVIVVGEVVLGVVHHVGGGKKEEMSTDLKAGSR